MPYYSNEDLPKKIRDVLPEHAQDTFRNAFNNTHEESGNEEQSFKIAWLAVKRAYRKNKDGEWVAK